jgi:ABC-type transporter Mla MlaB component
MGIYWSHYPEEDRLDLTLEGNLDLTLTRQLKEACRFVDERLQTCIIDCTRVARVFDSGKALLWLLVKQLAQRRVRLVIIGEPPELQLSALSQTIAY